MTLGETLKRTPLYENHLTAGGKMVPFAGWEMPVQYRGVIVEHRAVRSSVGLFDVSHMGEILVEGPGAFDLLNYLTCNNLAKLSNGRAQYSALTTESGGIVDDIIIYKYDDHRYFLCVNASNSDRDFTWINEHNDFAATVSNVSAHYAQIAVQGPRALELVSMISASQQISQMRSFAFTEVESDWGKLIVARTGYTGEDGVEIFVAPDRAAALWKSLLERGKPFDAQPIGLGARDTLRLEACLPLHGHELSEEISAIESGLSWIVKPQKGAFLGSEVLGQQIKEGAPRSLIGIVLDQPGIARQGDEVFSEGGEQIGFVTSGTRTPTIDKAIALALVGSSHAVIGSAVAVSVRGKSIAAHIVERPFYRRIKDL